MLNEKAIYTAEAKKKVEDELKNISERMIGIKVNPPLFFFLTIFTITARNIIITTNSWRQPKELSDWPTR